MNDSWFGEHVFEIAVRRSALPAELAGAPRRRADRAARPGTRWARSPTRGSGRNASDGRSRVGRWPAHGRSIRSTFGSRSSQVRRAVGEELEVMRARDQSHGRADLLRLDGVLLVLDVVTRGDLDLVGPLLHVPEQLARGVVRVRADPAPHHQVGGRRRRRRPRAAGSPRPTPAAGPSVGSTLSVGAQISTSRLNRSGCRLAICCTTYPPYDAPTACHRVDPNSSSTASTSPHPSTWRPPPAESRRTRADRP